MLSRKFVLGQWNVVKFLRYVVYGMSNEFDFWICCDNYQTIDLEARWEIGVGLMNSGEIP